MINVSNLTKRFASKVVIDDVSFSVQTGEVAGLIGENGAGKTTIMRILTGYLPASSGAVLVDGLDVCSFSLESRRRIGYLPENAALYPDMRVDEFLFFRAALKGVRRSGRSGRVDEAKVLCDLKSVEKKMIGRLSRGYLQRVGLADALIHDPRLLILDEPTIGLDPCEAKKIRELIRSLGSRYTVLLSTHSLEEAENVCHRLIILNHGKIIAADSPDNLVSSFAGSVRVRAEIFGPLREMAAELERLPGILNVVSRLCAGQGNADEVSEAWWSFLVECESEGDARQKIFDLVHQRGRPLRELGMEKRRLEDVFFKITRKE